MNVTQVRESRERRSGRRKELGGRWANDEPRGEQPLPVARTPFDVLLDICQRLEDPGHDGWQPVRARGAEPSSE